MTVLIGGQTAVTMFPAFADPGQPGDLTYNSVRSFQALEVIQPGRMVELSADGLTLQQCQATGSTTPNAMGIVLNTLSREGSGAIGLQAYGFGGPQYNIGDMVPVLFRGSVYAEWKGTTQVPGAMPNVYHSSTIAADRGKITDAATSAGVGTEIGTAGHAFRIRQALAGTGNIVLLDVNLPGAA
jgi:hypothetical protein